MADDFAIEMEGLNTVAASLEHADRETRLTGSALVRATAFGVVATAQDFVPVDTGTTKSSIHASAPSGGSLAAFSLEAEIGPTTEYAPHLEFGTVNMAPHAFMGPALDRHTPEFLAAAEEIAGRLL